MTCISLSHSFLTWYPVALLALQHLALISSNAKKKPSILAGCQMGKGSFLLFFSHNVHTRINVFNQHKEWISPWVLFVLREWSTCKVWDKKLWGALQNQGRNTEHNLKECKRKSFFIFINGCKLMRGERMNDLIQCWTNKPGLCFDLPVIN